jgi:transposase-like protein
MTIRLLIGDGIAGLWRAAAQVYPESRHQRCWRHKIANVLGRLPVHCQPEALKDLRRIYNAPDRTAAEESMSRFVRKYHAYAPAVDTLLRNSSDLLTYYEFPKAHWVSLKTTNPLESIFAPVRIRLNKAKCIPNTYSALSLVHQLLLNREARIRRLAAPNLTAYVAAGQPIPSGVTGHRWSKGRRRTA